ARGSRALGSDAHARPAPDPAHQEPDAANLSRHPGPAPVRHRGDRGGRVVAPTLGGPRRIGRALAALSAVSLPIAMGVSRHLGESKAFVPFVPGGVMRGAPGDIDRVEIHGGRDRIDLVRAPDGWRAGPDRRAVPASLAVHLDDSIKFLHVSAPIRIMERAEWAPIGLGEFGLDPPSYTATLYRGGGPVLGAQVGAPNPQQVLQYMKLDGRDQVYLMSRFVGQEWEQALREAIAK